MRARFLLAAAAVLTAQPASAEIVVGVSAPLTGRLAEQGKGIERSVADAVAELNVKRGGLLGEKLRVVAVDDGCDAKLGVEAARKLVTEKAAVVVGHPCASAALAAAPVYAQSGTLLFALTRHPDLTDKRAGPTIFRMAGRDDRQAEAITDYLLKSAHNKRIALVHDRTQYAKTLVERVYKGLRPAGIAPVLMETIVASEKNYNALAGRIKLAAADVLVFGGYPPEASLIMSNLKSIGVAPLLIGGDALAEPALSGRLASLFPRPAELSDVMRKKSRSSGEISSFLAGEAFEVWANAASYAKATSPSGLLALLSAPPQTEIPGVQLGKELDASSTATTVAIAAQSGPPFDSKGDAVIRSFQIYKSIDGKLSPAD